MIAYKLTDEDGYTRKGLLGETFWRVGSTVSPTGKGTKPCGPGVLHAYNHPLTAVLMDPSHAKYGLTARLFEIDAESWETDGLKRWTTGNCRVIRELELPRLSREERIATAIILAPHPSIREWAIKWLSGEDRTEDSAWAAAEAATWAAEKRRCRRCGVHIHGGRYVNCQEAEVRAWALSQIQGLTTIALGPAVHISDLSP